MKRESFSEGFCLGGCLMLLVALVLICGAVLWGAYSTYQGVYQMTSPHPQTLEPLPSEAKQSAARLKWESFEKSLARGADTEFRFSADDLNAWFYGNGKNADLVPHLRFQTNVDWIVAQVSVPLDFMAEVPTFPSVRGRFFNGSIAMRLAVEKDELRIKGLDVVGNGHRLPWLFTGQGYRDTVRGTLDQAIKARFPDGQTLLSRLQSIRVENGEIVVKFRAAN